MNKLFWNISISLIVVSLFAVSLAGATSFTLNGSDTPSAYTVSSEEYPELGLITPVSAATPAGPWATGSWMTFNNPDQSWPMDSGSGNLPGTYNYLTKFDLTGLDPSTAIIKGSWASDNGAKFYLNDISNLVSTSSGYTNLTYFTLDSSSGFVSGENFLYFLVTNDPFGSDPGINPTGLLVNFYESTANPVPEPSTLLLLGAGFIGVGFMRRRVKK
jgi:hypothetical protein